MSKLFLITTSIIALVSCLFVVSVNADDVVGPTELDGPIIIYPDSIPEGCPVFPIPKPWFRWGQRYIYKDMGTDNYSYLLGYGNYEPDYIDPVSLKPFKQSMKLNQDLEILSRSYYIDKLHYL